MVDYFLRWIEIARRYNQTTEEVVFYSHLMTIKNTETFSVVAGVIQTEDTVKSSHKCLRNTRQASQPSFSDKFP